MLGAVNGATGFVLIPADLPSLLAGYHAIGPGIPCILAHFPFFIGNPGSFAGSDFTALHTLVNTPVLVGIALPHLGIGCMRKGNNKSDSGYEEFQFHKIGFNSV